MRLVENINFEGAEFVEQDGLRIIKNVAMLGPESSHGYEYEQPAMAGAVSKGLYQGVRIFINHKEGERDVMHLAGVFRDPRHESMKIRGDAHLLPDEYGSKFYNIAKHMPGAASCSQIASGKLVTRNGKKVIECIDCVYSVDLVVQGATTSNVFEGDKPQGDTPMLNLRNESIFAEFDERMRTMDRFLTLDPAEEEVIRRECGSVVDDEIERRKIAEKKLTPQTVAMAEKALNGIGVVAGSCDDAAYERRQQQRNPAATLTESQIVSIDKALTLTRPAGLCE